MKRLRILLCVIAVLALSACSNAKGEEREDIRNYSLRRSSGGELDAAQTIYLLEKDIVGQGVFSSECISETDTFIASLLMEIIEGRGEISKDNGQYFADWTVERLREINWTLLDEAWESEGYQEYVVEEGLVYRKKILLSFSDTERSPEQGGKGLLKTGDAAASAESIGKILLGILESGGERASIYEEVFSDERAFAHFQELEWGQLGMSWKANPYYDCFYIDRVEENGCIDFLYNFYPDYSEMEARSAAAVLIRCSVDISDGKLARSDIMVCPMTEEEYMAARTWRGKRVPFVLGKTRMPLAVINYKRLLNQNKYKRATA